MGTFFLFSVNKKKTVNKKKWLVENLETSYNFYVFIQKGLNIFYCFPKITSPSSGVSRGKPIPLLGAKGNVKKKKWVSLILKELIKNIPDQAKIAFFFIKLLQK